MQSYCRCMCCTTFTYNGVLNPTIYIILYKVFTSYFYLAVLSPVHAVAEKCDCRRKQRDNSATVAELGDSRTFLRQCGQAFRATLCCSRYHAVVCQRIVASILRA